MASLVSATSIKQINNKLIEELQTGYINDLLTHLGDDEEVYFNDGVHPTHATNKLDNRNVNTLSSLYRTLTLNKSQHWVISWYLSSDCITEVFDKVRQLQHTGVIAIAFSLCWSVTPKYRSRAATMVYTQCWVKGREGSSVGSRIKWALVRFW